ncbi:hypothetical protein ACQKH5_04165 [Hyphomonas sp. NPDC076900]|uniref:hypothetical protein n=1 Tax=unclassified Hyphomonas TaxID=2630699 RepID=UPI003D014529
MDRLRPHSAVIDIDDTLRRLQIEDLLADNDWHDRILPFVTPGAPYESPWSRLVDAPYVLLTRLFELGMPREQALDLASLVWPPILLAPLIWLSCGAAQRLLGRSLNALDAALVGLFLIQAAVEFAPGRIDHHNFQILLLALFIRGLTIENPQASGLVMAGAATLSITVGLEAVPMLIIGLTGVAIAAVFKQPGAETRMQSAGIGLAVFAPLAALIFAGPSDFIQTHCDAISAPWILALAGAGLILTGARAAWQLAGTGSALPRVALLAAALTVLMILLWNVFPDCRSGPLHMIDPVTQSFWLDNVPQDAPAHTLVPQPAGLPLAVLLAAAIAICGPCAAAGLRDWQQGRPETIIFVAIVAAGIVMSLFAIRYMRITFFLAALATPLAVSTLLQRSAEGEGGRRRWTAAALAGSAAFFVAGFALPRGPHAEVSASYHLFRYDSCAGEDFSALHRLAPGVIMAPFGLHYAIIEAETPHTLSTISFYRSAPGIRKLATAFTTEEPAELRAALAGVDYVVVCSSNTAVPLDDMPLLRDLRRGQPPTGLEQIARSTPSRVTIYRIDHDRVGGTPG